MVKLSLPRILVAVFAVEPRLKEEKAPAEALEVPAESAGMEGAHLAGPVGAVGAGFEPEGLAGLLFGQRRVPGDRIRL